MQELRLYRNGITPKIRFATVEATQAYFNDQLKYRKFDIEGCIITQGTGYIDFDIYVPYEEAIRFSSLLVKNDSADGHSFIAFVDRIDYNNFNGQNSYVRLYFTIDWWSTLLYSGQDFSKYIEGDVIRSHVNDVELKGNVWYPSIDNTFLEPEFKINKYKIVEKPIKSADFQFLYILTTKTPKVGDANFQTTGSIKCGNKDIGTSYSLCIAPLKPYGLFKVNVGNREGSVVFRQASLYGGSSSSHLNITDSSVVGMFISDYCPFYRREEDLYSVFDFSAGELADAMAEQGANILFTFDGQDGSKIDAVCIVGNIPELYLNGEADFYGVNRFAYIKPISYEQYISQIPKARFYPYCITEIAHYTTAILDAAHIYEEPWATLNFDGMGTSYIIRQNSLYLEEEARYATIEDSGAFPTLSKNDLFTRINAWCDGISASYGLGKSIASAIASKGASLAVDDPTPKVVGTTQTIANAYKTLRDGEERKILPTAISNNISRLRLKRSTPIPTDDIALRKDLALYGYNTFLHPHVILENHKRKYFNYLRTSNCEITLNSLSQQAREHIEAMFNNGVWLWQTTDSFGNFEVPNYPIIMED